MKRNTCEELIAIALKTVHGDGDDNGDGEDEADGQETQFELFEVMGTPDGQTCKERKIDASEYPVAVKLLWPKSLPTGGNENLVLTEYRFVLRSAASNIHIQTSNCCLPCNV